MTEPEGPFTASSPAPAAPEVAHGRRVFRNTLISGVVGVTTLALNFVVVAYAIRHLGMDQYGVWVLALSFSVSAGYLSISDLGLQAGVVRFVADADGRGQRARIGEVISSALAVLIGSAVIAMAVLLALAIGAEHLFHVPPLLHSALRLLFFLLMGEALFSLPGLAFVGLLEGLQRYGWIKAVDLSRQVLYTVFAIVVLVTGHGVVAFGATTVAGSIFAAIGYAVAGRLLCPELRISPRLVHRAALRPLASFSAWVFVSRICGVIWWQMDKIILAAAVNTSLLTGYDIAARLQSAASYPLSLTSQAVVPAAANLLARESKVRLQALLVRGTRYTLALSLPVTIAAMVMARPLIVGWVGPSYAMFSGPAQLFLAYQLLVGSASIANTMLVGMGRVRAVTAYVAVAVAVNLVVSVALVQSLHISGVIIGTLVGFGITAPLYIRLVLRDLSMSLADFVRHAIVPIVPWAAIFTLLLLVTAQVINPAGLLVVALCCIPAGLVYIAGVVRFAMSATERRALLGFLIPARKES
jgi:O-antigen/teichoic acid export membrane protein